VISMRYWLSWIWSEYTLDEVWEIMSITSNRIQQIENMALKKLRRYMVKNRISIQDV
jgi:DNA-directed RNA polymerase sigma subunit (sigma70/sigma32)